MRTKEQTNKILVFLNIKIYFDTMTTFNFFSFVIYTMFTSYLICENFIFFDEKNFIILETISL